ncbi:multicopper oxidase domain-containing protein [Methylovulum psychrotolerans]|uniref:Bilirubin oxidase n=1 Tax=Methylovulum psychrotolerans TaxID=1704499 RepID=A0A1Z4BVW8_9GAMM|nr:multicopper oxidase domain-containing protein [Methylovulum psychrotolerans]ASF45418.1 bilirubin oxidase [Methylovulum psychrotolerans]
MRKINAITGGYPRLCRAFTVACLSVWAVGNIQASSLVPQTHLDGSCIPKFSVSLPVFGPAGSIPRVDAYTHRKLTVTMKEIDQTVLPKGLTDTCGKGVTFGKTRVWAYETADSATNQVLGPANWPAVTLETRSKVATQMTFVNQLPSFNAASPYGPGLVQGLIAVDQTLHWADPLQKMCGMTTRDCSLSENTSNACCLPYTGPVPTTVHLHGAVIPARFDGGPDSWFTPDGKTGSSYNSLGKPSTGEAIYQYVNDQEAGTLWFHDHALGVTRTNVLAGLAGFYFIRNPNLEPKKLPNGAYELEMAIQDRQFDTNSQLYFPTETTVKTHPYWSVMFEGDVAMVNGAPWPYLNVEPRRYRLRILNGSNHRSYDLTFGRAAAYQIGADEGYLGKPVKISNVHLSPGERADLIVDFSKLAGQTVTLANDEPGEMYQLPDIMQFRVNTALKSGDTSCNPAKLPGTPGYCTWPVPAARLTDGQGHVLPSVKIDKVRQFVINENFDYPNNIEEFVNNTKWDGLLSPSIAAEFPQDGVSETPRVGAVELWEIINIYSPGVAAQTHPIHTHLAQFQVLNRQAINLKGYLAAWNRAFGTGPAPLPSSCAPGKYCPGYGPPLAYNTPNADGAVGGNPALGPFLLGSLIPPDVGETGWKDTATAHAKQVLRVLVRWTPTDTPVVQGKSYIGSNLFPFDPTLGDYVWHCHIIDHEDNEMMRPYRVSN